MPVATATAAQSSTGPNASRWPIESVRAEFPILTRSINGQPLVYLDNASTTQKPLKVLDALNEFYVHGAANVHRGVHTLSQEASAAYEAVRQRAADFLGAESSDEIVFTAGTTAGLNLVAGSYGGLVLGPGDEVLVSVLEHHSNLVPWHVAATRAGAVVRGIGLTSSHELDLDELRRTISKRTKIVAIGHASNVVGTINPVREIAGIAHAAGAVLVVDGAQSAPHLPIDVRTLGCDFFVCSPHKMYGPMGVGLLFGKAALLERMPPFMGGGGMIERVGVASSTYTRPPARFEAGTPPVGEIIGLGAAIEYLAGQNRLDALAYELELSETAIARLEELRGVAVAPAGADRLPVVSFTVEAIHPHDVGTVLDRFGVAVRVGHHCAQPLMEHLGVPATVRASFAPYNTMEEVDRLIAGVREAQRVFGA
ncbi:MAG: SufS family cysteine desulfurase [Gemmatimonadota bacterium]